MAINWSTQVYSHVQDTFGRPVIFTPLSSQPGKSAYTSRGIFGTEPIDVLAEDSSIFSDMRTVLDILESDFAVQPIQGDTIEIPVHKDMEAKGSFEIIEVKGNGGGETSLSLRRIMESKP